MGQEIELLDPTIEFLDLKIDFGSPKISLWYKNPQNNPQNKNLEKGEGFCQKAKRMIKRQRPIRKNIYL